jgi:hypothetical protein
MYDYFIPCCADINHPLRRMINLAYNTTVVSAGEAGAQSAAACGSAIKYAPVKHPSGVLNFGI